MDDDLPHCQACGDDDAFICAACDRWLCERCGGDQSGICDSCEQAAAELDVEVEHILAVRRRTPAELFEALCTYFTEHPSATWSDAYLELRTNCRDIKSFKAAMYQIAHLAKRKIPKARRKAMVGRHWKERN